MKIVVICGKYSAKTFIGKCINIYKARKAAKRYWAKGYIVICPHSNSAFFDQCNTYEHFCNGYIEIIKRLQPDIIVMINNWHNSNGSQKEHRISRELGIAVIYE